MVGSGPVMFAVTCPNLHEWTMTSVHISYVIVQVHSIPRCDPADELSDRTCVNINYGHIWCALIPSLRWTTASRMWIDLKFPFPSQAMRTRYRRRLRIKGSDVMSSTEQYILTGCKTLKHTEHLMRISEDWVMNIVQGGTVMALVKLSGLQ